MRAGRVGFHVLGIKSHWTAKGEKRLDASYYTRDIASRVLIDELGERGTRIEMVGDLSDDVFWPGRFKRRYASRREGDPFLMPSEVLMLLPRARKWIVDYPDNLLVEKNWILITRSGTVGRSVIATRLLEGFILSDDLIRIVPKNDDVVGYLFAYLNTWVGQALLSKDQYGGTVKHIEPHHVASIPIPRIPELEEEIAQRIVEAQQLREEAQEALLRAEAMVHSTLGLPEIDEDEAEYFGGEVGKSLRTFQVTASKLNLRLDASYHTPILQWIEETLSQAKFDSVRLAGVIDKIFIPTRFKRRYVEAPNDGVPFLQGSHIPQMKLRDVKYLSARTGDLEDILLEKDWVLMTRSGTVGRIGIVSDGWNGWAASEHVLRLVVTADVHPGYIVAFLSSPYGEYQIKGIIYGAVVDEIGEQDTTLIEEIDILLPPKKVRDAIGSLVCDAYNKRDRANQIEDAVIELLENRLEQITKARD